MARKLVANPVKRLQSQILNLAAFTAAAATGTIDFNRQLPPGAIVLGWEANVKTAFTGGGATGCIISVGTAAAAAAFSARTDKSAFTAGKTYAASAPATSDVDAATTPRVTLTEQEVAPLFAHLTSGQMIVTIFYLDGRSKPI